MIGLTFALISSALPFNADARQLSPDEALNRALGISSSPTKMSVCSTSKPDTRLVYIVETDEIPTVYVYNQGKSKSYIVAANDAVETGLLGYTDAPFDINNIPPNVTWLLEQYGAQVAYAASTEENDACHYDTQAMTSRTAIEPILTTSWGQTGIYSAYCPEVNGTRCPAGCVATAMAQVMYHHRYPEVGTGSINYRPSGFTKSLSYDFSSNPFNWSDIELKYGYSTTTESDEAIGRLMLACGMACKTNYAVSGSGSSLITAARAMASYFGYDKGMGVMNRDYFTQQEWESMLYTELAEGRPVIYTGRSTVDGGHAFIIDGYDSNRYYHVNWGWSGNFDGYYILSALDPKRINAGFNYNETMLIGCRPMQEGSTVRPVLQFQGDLTVNSYEIDRNTYGEITITAPKGIFNQSIEAITVTLGVKLIGTDGKVSYVGATSTKTLVAGQGFTKYTIRQNQLPKSGRYLMSPAVKDATDNWHDIYCTYDVERALYVDCSTTSFTFTPESEIVAAESAQSIKVESFSISEGTIISTAFDIETQLTNTSSKHICKKLTPVISDDDELTVASGTEVNIELHAYETATIQWTCEFDRQLDPGTYSLTLIDENGYTIGESMEVVVATGSQKVRSVGIEEIIDDTAIDHTDIYDLNGRMIASVASWTTTSLNNGIYILRHTMNDGTVISEKISI
ncbi:MAG: C10 family peptidase [Bacteroides sp.]|nr:C10 family peptidase [Bacteroides sp.]MCM1413396.1 C10 family peptidase [Bacteroides sp.]MCM1471918.1 C10 family peptidase [Bacteroides sp.]